LQTSLLGVVVAVGLSVPVGARGQDGCEFGEQGNDVVNSVTLPGMGRVTYITRPHFVCQGGVNIFADSAVAYGDRGMSHLIGSVRYVESVRELLADEARYFTNEGRLQAEGNMSVRDDAQGSSIRNGDLVYLLQTEFRDEVTMTITTGADGLRPVALLTPPPREASPAPELDPEPELSDPVPDTVPDTPYAVEGDRMFLRGEGFFTAVGSVEIVRDSLFAFGDSAVYDRDLGDLVLEGSARVEGDGYELVGRRVQMVSPDAAVSEVQASREARLVGEGFELTAARIVIFLRDDALERLVAVPIARGGSAEPVADSADLERPNALLQDFVLTSDSLEILAPGDAMERVLAAGSAYSRSTSGDSLNVALLPDIARSDWLEGDTIVVTFAPSPDARDPSDVQVEAITAVVGARSLYRLPANDSAAVAGTDPPAVHYVMGDSIRIEMSGGQVREMRVSGQTQGVHLEPLRRPSDTAVVSDSAVIGIDTASAAADTGSFPAPREDSASTTQRRQPEPGSDVPDREHRSPEEVPWTRP
jgi:lipopolysaccharide export system protein LptA